MLFAVLVASQAIADDLPIVKTKFVIASRKFAIGLDAEKVEAERSIAAALARVGQTRYPFLDWRTDADPGEPAATLIIRLTQEEIDDTRTSFFMKYEGVVRGAEHRPVSLRMGSLRELYSAGKKNKPFHDRITLEANVAERAEGDLQTFATEFEASFVWKIPLCTRMPKIDSTKHMIVIDFPWEKMKTAPGSTLYVNVVVKKLAAESAESDFVPSGFIQLTDLERSGDAIGGFLGQIKCATVDTREWSSKIAAALDARRIKKISVHMQHYFYSDSGGGRAESPD
jgi:hypothetical protein